MKTIARTRQSLLLPHEVASTSSVQWNAKRYVAFSSSFSVSSQLSGVSGMANPITWIRERIAPRPLQAISKQEEAAARKRDEEKDQGSLFDAVPKLIEQQEKEAGAQAVVSKKVHTEVCPVYISQLGGSYDIHRVQHKYSTANFKISHRKLNMLARQIAGKPIDHAILQMEFSQKRAAKRIKSSLVLARQHAVEYKGMDRTKLIVGAATFCHAGLNPPAHPVDRAVMGDQRTKTA